MNIGFLGLGNMGAAMGQKDIRLTLLANGGAGLDWSAIGQLAARDSGQT